MPGNVKESIRKLADKPAAGSALDAAKKPSPVLPKTGFGQNPGGSSGISSPLTETNYADREFYTTYTLTSTDGLFVMELRRIKTMKFVDAAGRPVQMDFKDNV